MQSLDYEEGVAAARTGLTLFDCPHFLAKALPGHSGESLSSWKQKVDAWELGWRDETEKQSARADRADLLYALRH